MLSYMHELKLKLLFHVKTPNVYNRNKMYVFSI